MKISAHLKSDGRNMSQKGWDGCNRSLEKLSSTKSWENMLRLIGLIGNTLVKLLGVKRKKSTLVRQSFLQVMIGKGSAICKKEKKTWSTNCGACSEST